MTNQSKALEALFANFPNAVPNPEFVARTTGQLEKFGYDAESTLLATSLCCDEVNRVLEKEFMTQYKHYFSMGGLAGFPFGGVTSFGAMAHHVPDGGSCLVVYGPHVGIDSEGNIGKIDRRGRSAPGACCGSAADACQFVCNAKEQGDHGDTRKRVPKVRPHDAQQAFVREMLLPYGRRLVESQNRNVDLPFKLFKAMDDLMRQIVTLGASEVAGEGKIALLGGIQINTPPEHDDYFLPLKFQVRDNNNLLLEDLMMK